jgi:hypothetical protein
MNLGVLSIASRLPETRSCSPLIAIKATNLDIPTPSKSVRQVTLYPHDSRTLIKIAPKLGQIDFLSYKLV